jgi:3,4-dihydroxy 2-butanone 4-phosphate synthase/GTP cyclohydrolase II
MENNFKDVLERLARGEMVIVVDDLDRENEGDIIMLAEYASAEKTAFMVRHTTGILCVAITAQRAHELRLPYMVENNQDKRKTAFTVSVDFIEGLTTGVSAIERSATIKAIANTKSQPTDFIRPGHIYPLIAHADGLRARRGHTEAGIALAELAGKYPAALLSEIVAEDGSMAKGDVLKDFAEQVNIPIISIAQIKEYQATLALSPKIVTFPAHDFEWVDVQLENGVWSLATYPSLKQREQVVMRFGQGDKAPLVRIHSECFTGDVIGSQRCDCGAQLQKSIAAIEDYGYGYVLYLRDHEGRGIGLTEKLKAYGLQNQGRDTVDANLELGHQIDSRDWSEAISILKNLNLTSIKLLTSNPKKIEAVTSNGITCEQISLEIAPNEFSAKYLATKADRLGHISTQVTGGK